MPRARKNSGVAPVGATPSALIARTLPMRGSKISAWVSPPQRSVSHIVAAAASIAQAASTALPPFANVSAPAVAASGLPVMATQCLPCSAGLMRLARFLRAERSLHEGRGEDREQPRTAGRPAALRRRGGCLDHEPSVAPGRRRSPGEVHVSRARTPRPEIVRPRRRSPVECVVPPSRFALEVSRACPRAHRSFRGAFERVRADGRDAARASPAARDARRVLGPREAARARQTAARGDRERRDRAAWCSGGRPAAARRRSRGCSRTTPTKSS